MKKRRMKDILLTGAIMGMTLTMLMGCQGRQENITETVISEQQTETDTVMETETESETEGPYASEFEIHMIEEGDEVYNRINGKSYYENDDIALSDLRYLTVLHYDYDHQIQKGEIIVNKDVAEDVIAIFKELFAQEYEIQSMRLIDDYWIEGDPAASDSYSIENNNTSAFCYRVITGGDYLSNHAYGCAIDLNPLQNPYVLIDENGETYCTDCSVQYIDRDQEDPHIIREGDVCWTIFKEHGFEWGGSWDNPIDYQHFEIVID